MSWRDNSGTVTSVLTSHKKNSVICLPPFESDWCRISPASAPV